MRNATSISWCDIDQRRLFDVQLMCILDKVVANKKRQSQNVSIAVGAGEIILIDDDDDDDDDDDIHSTRDDVIRICAANRCLKFTGENAVLLCV